MKLLKEIRPAFNQYELKVSNRLSHVTSSVCSIFNKGKNICSGGNNVILISFVDKSNFKKRQHNISPPAIGVDSTLCPFDLQYFFSLNNLGQKNYLLDLIYKTLYSFFKHFGFDTKKLDYAYLATQKSDFYLNLKKVYSKDKKKSLLLECMYNYNSDLYRVVIEDLIKNEKSVVKLCEKELFIGNEHPELSINDILKIPKYMKYGGWISEDEYCYKWGDEQYIVSVSEKNLIIKK